MSCEEVEELLSPYHDRELGDAQARDVDRHLVDCAVCRAELARIRELSDAIHVHAPSFTAPSSLREKVFAIDSGRKPRGSWWPAFSMGAACGLAAAALFIFLRPTPRSALAVALVDDHVRSLMAAHLFDVPSSDRHTVKPWFVGKIDFSPTVVDLGKDGFPLLGGRLDYLDGRPAAVLVYGRAKHIINVFVQSGPSLGSPTEDLRGFHLVRWQLGDLNYAAVSDVALTDLRSFAQLFQREGQ